MNTTSNCSFDFTEDKTLITNDSGDQLQLSLNGSLKCLHDKWYVCSFVQCIEDKHLEYVYLIKKANNILPQNTVHYTFNHCCTGCQLQSGFTLYRGKTILQQSVKLNDLFPCLNLLS